jgi:hypothetical protein
MDGLATIDGSYRIVEQKVDVEESGSDKAALTFANEEVFS